VGGTGPGGRAGGARAGVGAVAPPPRDPMHPAVARRSRAGAGAAAAGAAAGRSPPPPQTRMPLLRRRRGNDRPIFQLYPSRSPTPHRSASRALNIKSYISNPMTTEASAPPPPPRATKDANDECAGWSGPVSLYSPSSTQQTVDVVGDKERALYLFRGTVR